MPWILQFARRLGMLARRGRFDNDLEREMRFHLEMQADENRDEGMSEGDAIDAARRRFGNPTLLRETSRDVWGWAKLERLAQDVRHALRALRRDRLFTSVAVLVLALGIAGNTTVFSLANALLLNPFPYPHADRLVEILSREGGGAPFATVHLPDFGVWRQQSTLFEAMGSYGDGYGRINLTGQSLPGFQGPERIMAATATDSFMRVLGVRPALGRFFTADEDRPGGPPVVVLSYGAWMRRFAGRADVLGQTLTLNGAIRTIVGVMPARLALPGTVTCEVWVPAAYDVLTNMKPEYNTQWTGDHVVARLKPGVSPTRAQTEITTITRRVWQIHPKSKSWEGVVVPLGSEIADSEGNRLELLALIVGTALLLACANLAGLLLARSAARSKELAMRAALGAGRSRLVRYALTETLLLALCGGALGLLLTAWATTLIGRTAPAFTGLDSALRIDGTVLAFALGLSLLTGVVFGLVPALQGSRTDIATVLKGASTTGRVRRHGRLLSWLVVVEVSLALLLLVGGGLMARTFVTLVRVDTGVRPDGVLTFPVTLAGPKYEPAQARAQFFATVLERLRLMPGVTAAGAVDSLPMGHQFSGGGFTIEGRPAPANWRDMAAQRCQATPQYFGAMGIPVVLGREFRASDGPAEPVVLINHALANRFFPGENPLGQRIRPFGTVVGVVGDVRHNGPGTIPGPQIYYPLASRPAWTMFVVVRTSGDPLTLVPLVRQQVHALDDDLAMGAPKTMTTVISESIADVRILTAVVGGFALFALALAAIGMYGVIAYGVSQRQHEIGIRMALGASRGNVLALLLGRAALLSTAGILIGVPLALAAVRVTASFLYGVTPHDFTVFTTVPVLLFVVALVASYLPARRATKIDPLDALRAE